MQIDFNKIFLFDMQNYKYKRNSSQLQNLRTAPFYLPQVGEGGPLAVDEDVRNNNFKKGPNH